MSERKKKKSPVGLQKTGGWPRRPILDRFWSKVDLNGPIPTHRADLGRCWLWTAPLSRLGYATFGIGSRLDGTRRVVHAHTWAYETFIGPLPKGKEPDHLCRIRHCIRPTHLEAATHTENVRRRGDLKLSIELARLIRERHAIQAIPYPILAKEFGVTSSLIGQIVRGKAWRET